MAKAIAPNAKQEVIGIRPGEKIHEQMIAKEEAPYTFEFKDYYKILPYINNWYRDKKRIKNGKKVKEDFDDQKLPLMIAMIDAILEDKKLEIKWENFS